MLNVFDREVEYRLRLILIENGSHDSSWKIIQELSRSDNRVSCVKLSRNFGMDGGLTAGLEFATSDAVILMASDLQDPPETIHLFENGKKVLTTYLQLLVKEMASLFCAESIHKFSIGLQTV